MTSSGWQVSAGLLMVILAVIIIAGFFFFTGKPPASSPIQNISMTTCPADQECRPGNNTVPANTILTAAETKISTDLLQLMGVKGLPAGMNRVTLEQQMEQRHQLTHVAATKETLVYVYVQTTGTADTALLTPYVWNITNSDPAKGLVVAWVDTTNLEKLALLESVRSIRTVSPPSTRGG